MWRKADDSKLKSFPGTPLASTAERRGTAAPLHSPNASAAVSQGIKMKGEISGQGDFFLDGEFEGTIQLTDGMFTVGPHARVTAEIQAREIIVRGEVIGSLKARERVHIASTGTLTGDMETGGIVVEDGAVLHSKVAIPQTTPPPVALPQAPPPRVPVSEVVVAQAGAPEAAPSETQVTEASETATEKDELRQPPNPEAPERRKRAAASASSRPKPEDA